MENFTIAEAFGPYRFIGKSVYVRSAASENNRGSGEILGAAWKECGWVFDELDALKDYASDEPHNAALITWDRYTDGPEVIYEATVAETRLMGYCIGRFMKPGTPVPPGMDCIDIPARAAAKGWVKGKEFDDTLGMMVSDEIAKSVKYDNASWRFEAEIYPKPDENGISNFGYYVSLHPLSELAIAKREKRSMPAVPALDVGEWPRPEGQYDPALTGVNIPVGARLYGLFDEQYYNYPAPENVPGFEEVATLEELELGKYCVYKASSGASYVILMSGEPVTVMTGSYNP
jgi:hypothetical protein